MRTLLGACMLWLAVTVASPAVADPLGALDQFCGGALSSPGCIQTIGEFPLETGAVVAIIQVEKSHISGAEDCKTKLGYGQSLYNEVAPYLGTAGVDVSKVIQCSCIIAFSTQTCSGEAEKIANQAADDISAALKALDGLFGIDDSTNQMTQDQIYDQYFGQYYKVVELKVLDVSDEDYVHTQNQLFGQCFDDWDAVPTPEDVRGLCNKFNARFRAETDPGRARYQAFVAGQAQVAADKLQAAKDAATTNARKTAMNWAQIKHNTYSPQCHDAACLDAVLALSFAYYGQMATGMQDLNASNTQVLIKTNQQFDPLFKTEIAKDAQRRVTRATNAVTVLATFKARPGQIRDVRAQARLRLSAHGVLNPEAVLRRAYSQHLRGRPYRVTTQRVRMMSRPAPQ